MCGKYRKLIKECITYVLLSLTFNVRFVNIVVSTIQTCSKVDMKHIESLEP
jgi:hypothetical protein